MALNYDPNPLISFSKYLLYGDPHVSYETLVITHEDQLRSRNKVSNFPRELTEVIYRTIINRIYYAAFHYASQKVTIKISMAEHIHKIHEQVFRLLMKENSSLGEVFDTLRRGRVYADYNEPKFKIPLTWNSCHEIMIIVLDLIRNLGYDILVLEGSKSRDLNNYLPHRFNLKRTPCNDFSCKEEFKM